MIETAYLCYVRIVAHPDRFQQTREGGLLWEEKGKRDNEDEEGKNIEGQEGSAFHLGCDITGCTAGAGKGGLWEHMTIVMATDAWVTSLSSLDVEMTCDCKAGS